MSNKSSMRELLLDEQKLKGKTTHPLAYMFRDMMLEHGILPSEWEARIDNFYRRMYTNARGEIDLVKVNQEKSNLMRALCKDTIPWNRFNTACQLMGAESYTLTLTLNYANGHKAEHKVKLRNRAADMAKHQAAVEANPGDDEEDGDE